MYKWILELQVDLKTKEILEIKRETNLRLTTETKFSFVFIFVFLLLSNDECHKKKKLLNNFVFCKQ